MTFSSDNTRERALVSLHQLVDRTEADMTSSIRRWANNMRTVLDSENPARIVEELSNVHMMLGNLLTSMSVSPMGTQMSLWLAHLQLEAENRGE